MIRVLRSSLRIVNLPARIPFRYGIAEMTAVPHLFLSLEVEIEGQPSTGTSADNLPPRWFTKDPLAEYEDEVADMLTVIQAAADHAVAAGQQPSVFRLWQETYASQQEWALDTTFPPLLWNFGVSLVERALIDAFCRHTGIPFSQAVRASDLGFEPGAIHADLRGIGAAELLPENPSASLYVRHTIGLSDPLYAADLSSAERQRDGLPHALDEAIKAYDLRFFKVKIQGDKEADIERLERIAGLLERECRSGFAFTLDGNEQYHDAGAFRDFWEHLKTKPRLASFLDRLLVVEQPVHRDQALTDAAAGALWAWPDRPSLIIDESDAELASLPRALECGYAGTSHKNCKGVFKGLANACLLTFLAADNPRRKFELTGEDLANVGPISLLQDLAVMAVLGLQHVERNGHHYFAGLSNFPQSWQAETLARHPDLYQPGAGGFPTLRIHQGRVNTRSVLEAPFGWGGTLDLGLAPGAEQWHIESLLDTTSKNQPVGLTFIQEDLTNG